MSLLSKETLLELIKSAIIDSGWNFRIVSATHPFLVYAYRNEVIERFRVYIWNITHGGGKERPADEYRIQITGVDRIDITPPLKTLLLGWDKRYKVFVGYNAVRYTTFGFSPSLQVKEGTLELASKEGIGIQPKEWDEVGDVKEVVVAFRPELFMAYVSNINIYHRALITSGEVTLIQKAVSRPLVEDELNILPEERRRAIRQVTETIRNDKFRKAVLQVYKNKCAICGLQLGLVEASHIVPVKEGGTDEITNGIALCPNHHKAFDAGLILLTTDYHIILNDRKAKELRSSGIFEGFDRFIKELRSGETILLPEDSRFHPKKEYIGQRMRLEGFRLEL